METTLTNDLASIIISLVLYSSVFIYAARKLKMNSSIAMIFVGAILLKLLLSLLNLYYIEDFLPHSGIDSRTFENTGYLLSEGILDISKYSWDNYPRVIFLVYLIVGRMPLLIITINGIASTLSAVYLFLIIKRVSQSQKKAVMFTSLFLYFPHGLIFSSVILRESLIVLFVTVSLYKFLEYAKQKKTMDIVIAAISLLAGSALHAGVLFLGLGYLIYIIKDRNIISRFNKLKKTSILVIIACTIVAIALGGNQFFRKINSFHSIENIVTQVNKRAEDKGGSAYLQGIRINSITDVVLYIPLKTAYFLLSPMPWDIRNISDIIALLLDSLFYYYFIGALLKKISRTNFKDPESLIFLVLLVGLSICAVVFALGTSNAGTALRHRFKLLPVLLVLVNIEVGSKKRRKLEL